MVHCSRACKAVFRAGGFTVPDYYAVAAQITGGAHAILIGDIVANENRASARELFGLHESTQGRPLVRAASNQFDHALAALDVEIGFLGHASRKGQPLVFQRRIGPVMQCRAMRLVFEGETIALGKLRHLGQKLGRQAIGYVAYVGPVGATAITAVRTGTGKLYRAQMLFQIGNRSSAHKREPSIQTLAKFMQAARQMFWHIDTVGRGRKVDKCAIEIEEERKRLIFTPAFQEFRDCGRRRQLRHQREV